MQKYITKGISREIPLFLQLFMWQKREELTERDYLQVFNLSSSEDGKQLITHKQEVPVYQHCYTFESEKTINAKVYIIDNETHVTMLLAKEY